MSLGHSKENAEAAAAAAPEQLAVYAPFHFSTLIACCTNECTCRTSDLSLLDAGIVTNQPEPPAQ